MQGITHGKTVTYGVELFLWSLLLLEMHDVRCSERASSSHLLVLFEDPLPVSLAAFHEEDLHGTTGPDAVCQERWTDRPESHLVVRCEIWPAVSDSGSLADALEG